MLIVDIVECYRDRDLWFEAGQLYLMSAHKKREGYRVYARTVPDVTLPSMPHFDSTTPHYFFKKVDTFRIQSFGDLAKVRTLPVEQVLETVRQQRAIEEKYKPKKNKTVILYLRHFPELNHPTTLEE